MIPFTCAACGTQFPHRLRRPLSAKICYCMFGRIPAMDRDTILSILKEYKKQNAQRYGITELGLFGSFARNQDRLDSDVDVYVKINTPDPFILVHLKEDLEGLLHRSVDIVRLREKMNPYLKNRIERDGIHV
jgi:predicted nucleotidyltransferase